MNQEKEESKLHIDEESKIYIDIEKKDTFNDNKTFLEILKDSGEINVFDSDGNPWTSLEIPKELNYPSGLLYSGEIKLYGTIIHHISELKNENEKLREEIQSIKDSLK